MAGPRPSPTQLKVMKMMKRGVRVAFTLHGEALWGEHSRNRSNRNYFFEGSGETLYISCVRGLLDRGWVRENMDTLELELTPEGSTKVEEVVEKDSQPHAAKINWRVGGWR